MENKSGLEEQKGKDIYVMLLVLLILIAQFSIGLYIILNNPPEEVIDIFSSFFTFGAKFYISFLILLFSIAGYFIAVDAAKYSRKDRWKDRIKGIITMLVSALLILWLWTDIL
jgi:hypothetical protein